MKLLECALVLCGERGSLSLLGKVYLRRLRSCLRVELRALAVLNWKLVVKVNRLDLLGDHLDLVLVSTFTADRKPLLDLHAIARALFLKRALKHQAVPRPVHHHLLLVVAIDHLICREHGLILKLSTILSLLGIVTVVSLANWWLLS